MSGARWPSWGGTRRQSNLEPDPISWRLPASALRERCETCGGSRCVVPPDCDCDVVTSLNFALCPHPPAECPDCQPVLEPLSGLGHREREAGESGRRCLDCAPISGHSAEGDAR